MLIAPLAPPERPGATSWRSRSAETPLLGPVAQAELPLVTDVLDSDQFVGRIGSISFVARGERRGARGTRAARCARSPPSAAAGSTSPT